MNAVDLAELLVTARKSERVIVFNEVRATPNIVRPMVSAYVTLVSADRIAEEYRVEKIGDWVGRTFASNRRELLALKDEFLDAASHPHVAVFFRALAAALKQDRNTSDHDSPVTRKRFHPQPTP